MSGHCYRCGLPLAGPENHDSHTNPITCVEELRRQRDSRMVLTPRQKQALRKVLDHIGSWTAARWDQHLRHDVGDEDTDDILYWAKQELDYERRPL